MIRDIATSVYRLADSHVLIGVQQTPQGPQPLFTEIDGESTVVAYTDVDQAKANLPDTHGLFSIQVASLLQQLPAHAGLVVDPRSPKPVHVPADGKGPVIQAAGAFPAGAVTATGDPAEEPAALLRRVSEQVRALRRLWRPASGALDSPQRDGPPACPTGRRPAATGGAERTRTPDRTLPEVA